MIRKIHCLATLLVLLILTACGPRGIQYTATLDDLGCSATRSVAVAVLDERPYVLNKEKEPSYVGTMRGGFGNPFGTQTESGAPLAEDMRTTLVDSLRAHGFSVKPLVPSGTDSLDAVLDRFAASDAERLIVLELKEWHSDYSPRSFGPERSELFVNADLAVFDRQRNAIARNHLQEELALPSGWPEKTVPEVYRKKIRQLIGDPRICRALR